MKKLDIITRSEQEQKVKDILLAFDVPGATITHVLGCGEQKGIKEMYRGTEVEINFLPKDKVDALIEILVKELSSGKVGDGKIFVSDISSVVKIRTGEILH
jgi:nitrogen regulatory protein P-II 1